MDTQFISYTNKRGTELGVYTFLIYYPFYMKNSSLKPRHPMAHSFFIGFADFPRRLLSVKILRSRTSCTFYAQSMVRYISCENEKRFSVVI